MTAPAISVTRPVGQALERVKLILFRPFDAAKWFTIGFCAWLALLGRRGFNFNYNFNHRTGQLSEEEARAQFFRVRDYVVDHLYWIVPVACVVLAFALTVWVLFTWLNSRGTFMFLHCVAVNRGDVAQPWRQYRREGNSLFGFRLGVGLIIMAVTFPLLGLIIWHLGRMFLDDSWDAHGIWIVVLLGLAWLGFLFVLGLIRKLTDDFVVPLMYRRRLGWRDGWSGCWRLLAAHPGEFLLYLLFQIPLMIAIAIVVVTVVIVTCCLAGCLLVLPYLGTVVLLPVLVFSRSYPLYYLAQFGPEFDTFAPTEPPVAAAAPQGGGDVPPASP